MRVPEPADIFKAQTSMLQWLRRQGNSVDFSHDSAVMEKIPFAPAPAGGAPAYRYEGKDCPYCHNRMVLGTKRFPTRDHVRPRRAGGTLTDSNCLIVCAPCNNDKADMMLREFVKWLERRNDPRADIVRRIDPEYGLNG